MEKLKQDKEVIIKVEGLCKTFVTTRAVINATVSFKGGEIHALIGENGSGKSTLTSMIYGSNRVDEGSMFLEGEVYSPNDQVQANAKGVAALVQEMNTLDHMTVAENIFLGRESMFIKLGVLNRKKMNAAAAVLLKKYNLDFIKPTADISMLSFEDRKIIEIIKAMNIDPKVLIVDETTTALSQQGRDFLYGVMEEMRAGGKTVIFISHDLQEVLEKSDSITVMRDGEIVDTIENSEAVTEDALKLLMVGRELSHKYYREDYDRKIQDEVVFEVKDITLDGVLNQISFQLHKGEILGIGGLTSCGMHELGKVMFGAIQPSKGCCVVTKRETTIKNIPHAIKDGVAYISKNRDQESLMLLSSICDNICLPSLEAISNSKWLIPSAEKRFAEEGATKLDVKRAGIDQMVLYLSGGNKQKVALAKWICAKPDIIIMDCPTRGIDIKVKAAIYEMMDELVKTGISIIMISEEMLELLGMSDRLLILNKGTAVAEIPRSRNLTEEDVIKYLI